MAVTKLIKCIIKPGRKGLFHRGQLAWSELNNCDGFDGQLGGWTSDGEAIVLGQWESEEVIGRFMDSIHDNIFKKSKQSEAFSHCQVQYFEKVLSISALVDNDESLQGSVLRLALSSSLLCFDSSVHRSDTSEYFVGSSL
ncbi:uncharacterized protein DUF4937 [Sinobacterium caligoides]|uniref:Uncharacterized protein DUF4937 n=1 Tax=Sinobacterium caligoides TaxID=933926 RepID=A0A3N2DN35_9GAMM|nr:DUF4937 domain-containing protein [Sinobacterium caligoides]ROS01092.1 uncharacterized protein DUF4937 [Sinobacterium caligoides]